MNIRKECNWKKQDGCHNCKKKFVMYDYDGGGEIFCNKNNDRPLCGSVALKESFLDKIKQYLGTNKYNAEYSRLSKKWDDWGRDHWTMESSVCDDWQEDEKWHPEV